MLYDSENGDYKFQRMDNLYKEVIVFVDIDRPNHVCALGTVR